MVATDFLVQDELSACLRFWLSVRRDRAVPCKGDLDPVNMPPAILPWTYLFQRVQGGRYLCRLMGSEACGVFGRNPTGCHLDEVMPRESYEPRRHAFDDALARGLPSGFIGYAGGTLSRPLSHCLALPAQKAGIPDHIFGVLVLPQLSRAASSPLSHAEPPTGMVRFSEADLARLAG